MPQVPTRGSDSKPFGGAPLASRGGGADNASAAAGIARRSRDEHDGQTQAQPASVTVSVGAVATVRSTHDRDHGMEAAANCRGQEVDTMHSHGSPGRGNN